MTGTVPLTIKLRLTRANSGRAVPGFEACLRSCESSGRNRTGTAGDVHGWVELAGAFPGAAEGRWPHLHVDLSSTDGEVRTVRLALPADVCEQVYGRASLSRAGHPVADGRSLEMASVTGDARRGFVATRTVSI